LLLTLQLLAPQLLLLMLKLLAPQLLLLTLQLLAPSAPRIFALEIVDLFLAIAAVLQHLQLRRSTRYLRNSGQPPQHFLQQIETPQ
jgi:hypothetical protein